MLLDAAIAGVKRGFLYEFLPTLEREREARLSSGGNLLLDLVLELAGAVVGSHQCIVKLACRTGLALQQLVPGKTI